jgi:hypothetical protein
MKQVLYLMLAQAHLKESIIMIMSIKLGKFISLNIYYYLDVFFSLSLNSRVDRTTGKYNGLCSSVTKEDIPCTDLVVDGFRYLVFPTIKNCCMCCTTEEGCGILRPDWLLNATFIGYNTTESVKYQIWDKKGFQDNYYWQVDATQVPYIIYQHPNDNMVFNVSSFSKMVDPSVFALPSYCSKDRKCPPTSCNF